MLLFIVESVRKSLFVLMVGGIVEAWWKIAKMRTFAWWIFETGELLNLKKQLPSHKREVQLGPQRFEALPWAPQRNLEQSLAQWDWRHVVGAIGAAPLLPHTSLDMNM